MDFLNTNFLSLLVLFILGLRHGLDPDHITVIDNFTYRLYQNKNKWSKYVGTFFTIGHGVMVTIIALCLGFIKNNFNIPIAIHFILAWVPMVLLLMVGIGNIINLKQKNNSTTIGIKKHLIPKFLQNSSNPIAVFFIGLIFGFIFDTSSQIAAFALAVSGTHHWAFALLGGITFSLGLIITGTVDSYILNLLLVSFDKNKIQKHRYKLTILITIMCFVLPLYKIITVFFPDLEPTEFQNNLLGIIFLILIIGLYLELYYNAKKTKQICQNRV